MSLPDLPPIRLIRATNFTRVPASAPRVVRKVVIHSAETGEHPLVAENIAAGSARPDAPETSWHYAVDSDSIVQSVLETDVAWHAPGANRDGIGIELAGRARQTLDDWSDAYSRAMLILAANLTAHILARHRLPARLLHADDLRADPSASGITYHHAVSVAFRKSTHTDPGPGFPWVGFLANVRALLAAA